MRSGPLIAGVILIAFGAVIFVWTYNMMADGQTSLGQLGRLANPILAAQYKDLQNSQLIAIPFIIAGIGALIYGAAKK